MLGTTPMFKQYDEIKQNYQDSILFYRLGDFYEMFGPDAEKASQILGIALTARDGGGGQRVPMCGIPYHAAENYLAKLIAANCKVAVCEQMEDPKETKGIVKRDVIRVITPGVLIDDGILDKASNYIIGVSYTDNQYGLAISDVSTGKFLATQFQTQHELFDEIDRFSPVECVCNVEEDDLIATIKERFSFPISQHLGFAFDNHNAKKIIVDHFKVNDLLVFGYKKENFKVALCAAGGLFDYMSSTLKKTLSNITTMSFYQHDKDMFLDTATRFNLELTRSIGTNDKRYTLFDILDHTMTAAGSRLLKEWIERPLVDEKNISNRLDATDELVSKNVIRNELRALLRDIYDIERIVSRISYGSANAKDLLSLRRSLGKLPEIKDLLNQLDTPEFQEMKRKYDDLSDIYDLLAASLHDQAPFSLREGNLIKGGYNEDVDQLREIIREGEGWLTEFAEREKERTGIKNLKIGSNKVFGYYIEITKSQLDKVPEDYERKQTLVNNERFITRELKDLENRVVGSDDRLKELEYFLFTSIRNQLAGHTKRFLNTAYILSTLDVFASLAEAAILNEFNKPAIHKGDYHISGLRHPIVEKSLSSKSFVPNDVHFIRGEEQFLIITGPNMSGKSTYCRSVALASIMMQIGSFIPAKKAIMPVVDRVFARIGANDLLSQGQSTFMVEMNEVANILNHATMDSLIVLDEVGRGTSTFDGVAIAYAICKYINEHIGAKTLFATHYHELTSLDEDKGIANYSVAIQDDGKDVIFMHTIIPGAANKSYGVHVAKMAGLPRKITDAANRILFSFEEKNYQKSIEANLNDEEIFQAQVEIEAKEKKEHIINLIRDWDLESKTVGENINFIGNLKNEVAQLLESENKWD